MTTRTTLKALLLAAAAGMLAACGGTDTADTEIVGEDMSDAVAEAPRLTLADAVAHERRADDAAADVFRHPAETLEFFQIGEGQRVAEIWPGYYTPILAPYLADNDGTYVAILYPEGLTDGLDGRVAAFKERYADTGTFGTIDYASFLGGTVGDTEVEPVIDLPDNSVDRVLSRRNVHSWMRGGYADAAFSEAARILKPGGMMGVVAHRLPETRTQDPKAASGYVQESYIKALAADAGLEFVASSEVNANPLDTADHPMGVWTLPPRSRLPEAGSVLAQDFDAEAYRNIGESDRATLLFRKPG